MTQLLNTSTAITSNQRAARQTLVAKLRAGECARHIAEGFLRYDINFRAITRRAHDRFSLHDWQGSQLDAAERDELYEQAIGQTVDSLKSRFGDLAQQQTFWQEVQHHFADLMENVADNAFGTIFYNNVTRCLFQSERTTARFEFAASEEFDTSIDLTKRVALHRVTYQLSTSMPIVQLLNALPLEAEWADVANSAEQVAHQLGAQLRPGAANSIESMELLDTVFYQFTRAYAIGQITGSNWSLPCALSLANTEAGVVIDEVMVGETALNELFDSRHACFHADLENVAEAVMYLQTLLPNTHVNELLGLLGRPSHTQQNVSAS